jgi:hypothetical protein
MVALRGLRFNDLKGFSSGFLAQFLAHFYLDGGSERNYAACWGNAFTLELLFRRGSAVICVCPRPDSVGAPSISFF